MSTKPSLLDEDKDDAQPDLLYDLPFPEGDALALHVSVSPPPNNALHLHLPSTGDLHVLPPSVVYDADGLENTITLSPNPDSSNNRSLPARIVRFRSRVRIASGTFNHRARSHSHLPSHSAESLDSESSPSSSISAPLRSTPDDSIPRPSYSFAVPKRRRQRPLRPRAASASGASSKSGGDGSERTPLLRAPGSRLGARTRRLYGDPDEDDEASSNQRVRISREEVNAFGSWPWRLFNGYVRLSFFTLCFSFILSASLCRILSSSSGGLLSTSFTAGRDHRAQRISSICAFQCAYLLASLSSILHLFLFTH